MYRTQVVMHMCTCNTYACTYRHAHTHTTYSPAPVSVFRHTHTSTHTGFAHIHAHSYMPMPHGCPFTEIQALTHTRRHAHTKHTHALIDVCMHTLYIRIDIFTHPHVCGHTHFAVPAWWCHWQSCYKKGLGHKQGKKDEGPSKEKA